MLFQNTSVTRGTASMVVTATGMQTQMGQIATMLTSVTRTRSPLQKELDSLTKVLGIIAWSAVAFIFVVGLARGHGRAGAVPARHRDGDLRDPDRSSCVRVGTPVAGCEAARRLQGDREEPDRRRDAGRDERDQHRQDRHPHDEPDDGVGRLRERRLVHGRGRGLPQDGRDHVGCRRPGAGLHQPRARHGARQRRDGRRRRRASWAIRPRRRWWCLSAKLGVDAEETRRSYPRLAEVPFDSEYKFMATFHRATLGGRERVVAAGEGRSRRRARAVCAFGRSDERDARPDRRRAARHRRRQRAHGRSRDCACSRSRRASSRTTSSTRCRSDPMSLTHDLDFVGHGRHHRPTPSRGQGRGADRARRRHRRAHDHRRPRRHRRGDRQGARARTRRDQRDRAPGAVRRRAGPAAAAAARVRPGLARGQAPPRARHARRKG